jgi:hypothetical protein
VPTYRQTGPVYVIQAFYGAPTGGFTNIAGWVDGGGLYGPRADTVDSSTSDDQPAGVELSFVTQGADDAPAEPVDHVADITDPVGLLDDTVGGLAYTADLTDSLGLLDTPSTVQAWALTLVDPVGLSDAPSTVQGWAQALTDALGLLDVPNGASVHTRTPIDAVGLSDTVADSRGLLVDVTDTLGLGDTTTLIHGLAVVLIDAVGLSDGTTRGGSVATPGPFIMRRPQNLMTRSRSVMPVNQVARAAVKRP